MACPAPDFAPFSSRNVNGNGIGNRNDEDQAFKKLYCLGMPKVLCEAKDEDGRSPLKFDDKKGVYVLKQP